MDRFDLRKFIIQNREKSKANLNENVSMKKVPRGVATDAIKPHGKDTVLLSDEELKNRVDGLLNNPKDFPAVKDALRELIQSSRIRNKERMVDTLEGIKTPYALVKWFYNSILAKAGLWAPDSQRNVYESEEEVVPDETGMEQGELSNDSPEVEMDAEDEFDITQFDSVEDMMNEIERSANEAALKEKMNRTKRACEALENKTTALEEGEDSKYISSAKIKEMKRGAKKLRRMYESYVKEYEKKFQPKEKK